MDQSFLYFDPFKIIVRWILRIFLSCCYFSRLVYTQSIYYISNAKTFYLFLSLKNKALIVPLIKRKAQ